MAPPFLPAYASRTAPAAVGGKSTGTTLSLPRKSDNSADIVLYSDTVATYADAVNLAFGSTNGTQIGTAPTQKLAFYGGTAIVQPSSTTDLRVALINLGLYATGGASPLDLNGGAFTAAAGAFSGNLTNTNGSLTVTDGTASHGKATLALTAFGSSVSVYGNSADAAANPKATLFNDGSLQLGGGSGVPDWKITRTGAAAATVTGDWTVNHTTFADGKNVIVNTTTGTQFATGATQKIAFYGGTPIVQPSSTTDLRTALINLGLYATGGASPLNLNGGAFTTTGTVNVNGTSSALIMGGLVENSSNGVIMGQVGGSSRMSLNFGSLGGIALLAVADNVNTKNLMTFTGGASGGSVGLGEGTNLTMGTTTGSKIGGATNQKIGFWNATPVVQQSRVGQLTDSTAGTPGATLAALTGTYATDVATLRNWGASLATKVNGLDTVNHTLGLTA